VTALTRTEWLRLPLSVFYALAIAVIFIRFCSTPPSDGG